MDNFHEKLKALRKEKGVSQEKLADFLGVTFQAVSKWETGSTMPDITFLPQIASYYDITVDELLGVGEINKQEKIHEYLMKNHKLGRDGQIFERVELWREAYREFPNDMAVNEWLMQALFNTKDEKFYDEILSLGERILHKSTDERQRSSAIQTLCYIYNTLGDKEKAKEYAEMSTPIGFCKEVLLSEILDGDEGIRQNLELMLDCLDCISSAEIKLCKNDNVERELWLHEFYLKLLELYFDDGFYGIYAMHAGTLHRIIAKIYLSHRKDEQKTIEHLKSAAKFANQYDCLPDSFVYTSTLLNGYKNNRTYFKSYSETECEMLLNFLGNLEFDIVRDKDWFKAIVEELEAAKACV